MGRSRGATLLELQRVDLEIARLEALEKHPGALDRLKALLDAAKRVQALITQLTGRVKDSEMDLQDLSREQEHLSEEIEALKERARAEAMDHRQQAWTNEQHASLMKRLDKVNYAAEHALEQNDALAQKRDEALAAKAKLDREIERVKAEIRETVQGASEKRTHLLEERQELEATLDEGLVDAYERALERFDGLAVEELHGNRPSVCRMALEPRSVEDAWHHAPISQCPYCRRILIVGEEDA